ncbi:MAG: hypothetical protein CVV49_13620 [Spirochaetae bacterium HGW-Spirochaetae-5]|nr:MAG: hypothetical protein CVV49_13620 [Spirochaetae bacterium HGW-Spirochaetae-5]
MKKIFACFILLFFILPAVSQDAVEPEKKAGEAEQVSQSVYTEITLEDFESTQYTDANLKFVKSKEQQASLAVRDQYPAEFNNSKKYLGVKLYAKKGDTYQIFPAKPLEISKYCRSISVWVYGKKFSGELSIMLQDVNGTTHRLTLGNTAFLGWKKLTINLPTKIKQQDDYLEKENTLKILHIQYRAANNSLHPEWQYFYIDDITATVRDKYKDRQSDDW